MSKTPKNTGGRPERSWRLVKGALSDYRRSWVTYIKIAAIVAVPFNLLTLVGFTAVDVNSLDSFGTFASIIMNVALIWAIIETGKGNKPNVPRSYYQGTSQFVSYLVTSILVLVMLIPLAFALLIFTAATAPGTGTSIAEIGLVGGLALVLALPSIYALVRFGLGLLLVITDQLRPMAALKASRRLTFGHFWPLVGRFVILGLFLILLTVPVAVVATALSFIKLENWAVAVFQIGSTLTILPIAYLYLMRLLRSLQPKPAAAEEG